MKKFRMAFLYFLFISICGMAQNRISDINELIGNTIKFADSTRLMAPWPPLSDTLHVLIDSDAAYEVDDQYVIAMALGFPEKIKIERIIASHYGVRIGSSGIKKSYDSIKEVLEKSAQ